MDTSGVNPAARWSRVLMLLGVLLGFLVLHGLADHDAFRASELSAAPVAVVHAEGEQALAPAPSHDGHLVVGCDGLLVGIGLLLGIAVLRLVTVARRSGAAVRATAPAVRVWWDSPSLPQLCVLRV
ncbi:DUF6153 family protein [Kribbella sp. NPDC051770]|uniref:DUF6153 family protein n=1 Tax=Kribbella sp. NPDC051770 TaxID=3155413 RepID=UPI003440E876